MKIRDASTEDIKQIMQLQSELFSKWDSMDEIDKIDNNWFLTKEHHKKIMEDIKTKKIIVAEENNKVISYLKCEITEREPFLKKVGYISETYMIPEYRRQKIGTELLNKALEWFKENKLEWATTSTHSLDSEANDFWKRKNYKEYNNFFKMKL